MTTEAGQPTFQAMCELRVAFLVQIHDGQGRAQLAALWHLVTQRLGQAFGVQPGDDGRCLRVVQAGYAVVYLVGVVGTLAADHEHGETVLDELVAENVGR